MRRRARTRVECRVLIIVTLQSWKLVFVRNRGFWTIGKFGNAIMATLGVANVLVCIANLQEH